MRNKILWLLLSAVLCQPMNARTGRWFNMRGAVLSVEDLETVDWPRLAHEHGINTLGTHITPEQVRKFWLSDKGRKFQKDCRKYGIKVEHELHAMKTLLPRELFSLDSTMFRMNAEGRRVADFNCCATSQRALDTIAFRALYYARQLKSTNHRYYFWLDDGAPVCQCPECAQYSPSEQALMIENRILAAIRTYDSQAKVAHLAYLNTLQAPVKVKPAEGIFLEFAPIKRRMDCPITDAVTPVNRNATIPEEKNNAENLVYLKDNLKVFPAKTAVILDYWLDVSLASKWRKPAVQLPWHKEVFLSDIATYARLGIRNVTTFAVYMDEVYFQKYPSQKCLQEYGAGLSAFRLTE